MKSFIITVDTEGDDLWNYKLGNRLTTVNSRFIPRFQHLCQEFGFKPVYLTNYEMAECDRFVSDARNWLQNNQCEIGVHLHAWNNPPIVRLNGNMRGLPYLIEYPEEVMRKKFEVIYNLIKDQFEINPESHRAGRWAMNQTYFRILHDFGIKTDCSHTPFISWATSHGVTSGGSDYSNVPFSSNMIGKVLEVPMTVRYTHIPITGVFKERVKTLIKGRVVWLRPATESLQAMNWLMRKVANEESDYLEFMIHSSELMPGGSPYNPTEESIELFYKKMLSVFQTARSLGFEGCTLSEYYKRRCAK